MSKAPKAPNETEKDQVKKVKPYPFSATLELGAKKVPAEVQKVTTQGALVNPGNIIHVGEEYKMTFELPASYGWVVCAVKVMKTYDKYVEVKGVKTGKVERLAELRFLKLSSEHRDNIQRFESAIRQN